jgi:hypothetical protein
MNDILINKGTHVAAAVVEFTDGRSKAELISEGSKEECEALAELIPFSNYGGPGEIRRQYVRVLTQAEWRARNAKVIP